MKLKDLKGKEFKVYTKTKAEYEKVVEIAVTGGYKGLALESFSNKKNWGIKFFSDMDMTDGDSGNLPITFTAQQFITANTTTPNEHGDDFHAVPIDNIPSTFLNQG